MAICRERVGDHDLLEQADREDGEADREVSMRAGAGRLAIELRHHLLVVDDRAGDQLGEEGDEQAVVVKWYSRSVAAVERRPG